MTYTTIQFLCLIFSLISFGGTIDKNTAKFDKVLSLISCIAFFILALYIEEVLK